ncbi:nuclear transport factor 2 family protein [Pseudocolwellia agarivorans]|uniref:nuclear transport factor 2 family protein n=1 Tax=Pseudocolwellia agarivorans TaxID=1911682 RepID=UPI001FEB18A4|nr:nuclear transport factor 2 family protein [Pseudocolwellia agarivorans]
MAKRPINFLIKYFMFFIIAHTASAFGTGILSEESMTNLEIVQSTYEGKTSEENGKNLQKYLSRNVQWREADGFPYAGTYQGFNEIASNVFAKLASQWDDYKFTAENYVAQNNIVIAYGTYSGTYRETGKSFNARVAHIWKLKDKKIISFEQIVDSKMVTDAMH